MPSITTPELNTRQDDRLTVPWDLSEWVEKKQLVNWIEQEISQLDWQNPELARYLQAHPPYRPRMMLALLTFAYSTGVFQSDEISNSAYSDAELQSICEGDPPEPSTICRFRRDNRGLLKWSLLQVLKRAIQVKFEWGQLFPAGLRRFLLESAIARLDLARHLDLEPRD